MTAHSARASVALRLLAEADPALAALALWCTHRDAETGPATRTSGETILYGPAFATLARYEQVGLCAHHILHVALRHPRRLAEMAVRQPGGFSTELWTFAADAIVNETVLAAGHALPRPAVTLSDLLAATGTAGGPQPVLAAWDVERLYHHLVSDAAVRGRAEGLARALAFVADLTPEAGTAESGERAAEWRGHLTRALEAGRASGRGLGVIGLRLGDLPQPRVPWETVLRGLVTRAVTSGVLADWRRPARGWIAAETDARSSGSDTPAFRPGTMQKRTVPRIGLGLDTSSSVDDLRMDMFLAEIGGIARRCGAEIVVLPFDEQVEPPFVLAPGEGPQQLGRLQTRRGGGTDFRPLLTLAAGLQLSALVVLTDLEGETGTVPPGLPVIWAVPGHTHRRPARGQLVVLTG